MQDRQPALAELLHDVARSNGETVSVAALVRLAGSRAHGVAILLMSLPEALPLPIPSVGLFLAVPILLVSLHLAAFGEGGGLPPSLARRTLATASLKTLDDRVGVWLRRAEGMSARRWGDIASRERMIGGVCAYLAFVLMLPIPLLNIPPALCLSLLAWGMIHRDGVAVALGLLGTVLLTIFLGWSVDLVGDWWAARA